MYTFFWTASVMSVLLQFIAGVAATGDSRRGSWRVCSSRREASASAASKLRGSSPESAN